MSRRAAVWAPQKAEEGGGDDRGSTQRHELIAELRNKVKPLDWWRRLSDPNGGTATEHQAQQKGGGGKEGEEEDEVLLLHLHHHQLERARGGGLTTRLLGAISRWRQMKEGNKSDRQNWGARFSFSWTISKRMEEGGSYAEASISFSENQSNMNETNLHDGEKKHTGGNKLKI